MVTLSIRLKPFKPPLPSFASSPTMKLIVCSPDSTLKAGVVYAVQVRLSQPALNVRGSSIHFHTESSITAGKRKGKNCYYENSMKHLQSAYFSSRVKLGLLSYIY